MSSYVIVTATITADMKSTPHRGKTSHACSCVIDSVEGEFALTSGDNLGLTLSHLNWIGFGNWPRLKAGQSVKLRIKDGVNPTISISKGSIKQHEARLILKPIGHAYSHDRAAELLEVIN